MIIEILFIFTVAMCILGSIKLLGLCFGNSFNLPTLIPFLLEITPTHRAILYPSVLFQVWFWTERLGVFVQ